MDRDVPTSRAAGQAKALIGLVAMEAARAESESRMQDAMRRIAFQSDMKFFHQTIHVSVLKVNGALQGQDAPEHIPIISAPDFAQHGVSMGMGHNLLAVLSAAKGLQGGQVFPAGIERGLSFSFLASSTLKGFRPEAQRWTAGADGDPLHLPHPPRHSESPRLKMYHHKGLWHSGTEETCEPTIYTLLSVLDV